MKRFILNIALLIFCSVLLTLFINLGINYFGKNVSGLAVEVFLAREKAQAKNSDCTIVYLGDSVCNQLWSEFDEDVDGICHLGCNAAITPVGSYLLLKEYLENNPQTETAYLLVRPQTLANDIWLDFSYQYFVIPFLDGKNMSIIEEQTRQEIYEKFGKIFVDSDAVKATLLNNNLLMKIYLTKVQSRPEVKETHRLSNAARIYLGKMDKLCQENEVELIIKANPLSDTDDNRGWTEYENDIAQYGFEDLLSGFIDGISFYPEDWFSDGVHFKPEVLAEYGDEIRQNVLD